MSRATSCRRLRGLLVAPLLLAASVACGVDTGSQPGGQPLTRPFAADSPWNAPLPAHPPLAPGSAQIVRRLAGQVATANLYEFGTPVFDADAGTTRRRVRCTKPWGTCELQAAPVPIPEEARPAPGSDGAMVVIDQSTRTSYDFYQAKGLEDGTWTTGWGSATSLNGDGRHGETGAGISLLAGLIRTSEIRRGHIDHAIEFASEFTCRDRLVYPAVKTDGTDDDPGCIPMGSRLQLDTMLDVAGLPGLSPAERAIATALQRYGGYVRNSSGAPLAVGFEKPSGKANPYPAAGLTRDFAPLRGIPLDRLRVVAAP